jgi:hypothetical protein
VCFYLEIKSYSFLALSCWPLSSAVTELRIGQWENFGFQGDLDGNEDTSWHVVGGNRAAVPWPFWNCAPCHIV